MKYNKLLRDQKKRNKFNEVIRRKNKIFYQKNIIDTKILAYSGKNRCLITGAGKSPVTFFRLSRHMFRKYANNGLLPGIQPSSW